MIACNIISVNVQQAKAVYKIEEVLLRLMQLLGTQKFSKPNQLSRK